MFKIKKISTVDYLKGHDCLIQIYDTYKVEREFSGNLKPDHLKKVKKHFKEVFMASVVKPVLTEEENDAGVCIDDIFLNWDLAAKLYNEILYFTYGKKKLKKLSSQKKDFWG